MEQICRDFSRGSIESKSRFGVCFAPGFVVVDRNHVNEHLQGSAIGSNWLRALAKKSCCRFGECIGFLEKSCGMLVSAYPNESTLGPGAYCLGLGSTIGAGRGLKKYLGSYHKDKFLLCYFVISNCFYVYYVVLF